MIDAIVVGVDCATDLKNVGIAYGRLQKGRLLVEVELEISANRIAERIAAARRRGQQILLAIDAPLGWPSTLGEALQPHKAGQAINVDSNLLFRRETDRWVKKHVGKQPLDVGADRIARTAHAALRLLEDLRQLTGLEIPLVWSGEFADEAACIEVYPAATLRACGFQNSGYKGNDPGHRERRIQVANDIGRMIDLTPESLHAAASSDDALDATICVLAGFDFLTGYATPPENVVAAKKEGWIWVRLKAK